VVHTAISASAIIFLDFSRSLLSWAASAISDARKRRFSTYRVDIWAFNSSIRILSVELSLASFELVSFYTIRENDTYLVICLLARRNFFLTVPPNERLVSVAKFEVLNYRNTYRLQTPTVHHFAVRLETRVIRACSSLPLATGQLKA
jgi:hypothetical protein